MVFTRGQLEHLAKHVTYEMRQLRNACAVFDEGADERVGELVAVAGYVHCRNLLAFFSGSADRRERNVPIVMLEACRGSTLMCSRATTSSIGGRVRLMTHL